MNVRRVSISTVTLKNNDWIKKICMCLGSITIIIKFLRGKKTSMKYIDFFIKKKSWSTHNMLFKIKEGTTCFRI